MAKLEEDARQGGLSTDILSQVSGRGSAGQGGPKGGFLSPLEALPDSLSDFIQGMIFKG